MLIDVSNIDQVKLVMHTIIINLPAIKILLKYTGRSTKVSFVINNLMNKIKKIAILIIVFILAATMAFFLEGYYYKLIVNLFVLFQGDNFYFTGKAFHLPGNAFVYSFGLFVALITAALIQPGNKHRIRDVCITIFIFFATTSITTYFHSYLKITPCRTCDNTRIAIAYRDLNTDGHFFISLAVALIPSLIFFLRSRSVLANSGKRKKLNKHSETQ